MNLTLPVICHDIKDHFLPNLDLVFTSKYRNRMCTKEERICPLCSDGVEDETHFICICEYYKLQRDELFNKILITYPNFNNLTNIDKLAFLMKYEWKTLMQYRSLIRNFRKENLYVASKTLLNYKMSYLYVMLI